MVHSKDERIRLAQNLWQILVDLRPRVKTKDILRAADQGGETDSTKRLPYFAINPDLPPQVRDKRAEKLTKSIKKYVKIVAESARLSREDKSELIRRFVAGTRYFPLKEDIEAADIELEVEGWADIEEALQKAATRISHKYNLSRFFKLVRTMGIGIDRKPVSLDTDVLYPPKQVCTYRLPLRPSVYLGEVRVCDDIPCKIDLDFSETVGDLSRGMEIAEDIGEKEKALYLSLRETGLIDERIKGVVTPVLRASLDLLPVGKQDLVTAILRLEPRTYIAFAEDFTGFEAFGGSVWRANDIIASFDEPIETFIYDDEYTMFSEGYNLLAATDVEFDASVKCEFVANFASELGAACANSLHAGSSSGASWIFRFVDSARTYMNRDVFTPPDEPDGHQAKSGLWNLDFASKWVLGLTSFPPDTMAALLERSLFHAPELARLDHLLDENTRTLTQELGERIAQARARRHERLDELRRE